MVLARRLSNAEYDYSIRDLTGGLTTINNSGFISATGTAQDVTYALDVSGGDFDAAGVETGDIIWCRRGAGGSATGIARALADRVAVATVITRHVVAVGQCQTGADDLGFLANGSVNGAGDLAALHHLGGALVEETALLARWLAAPGARIVRADTGDVRLMKVSIAGSGDVAFGGVARTQALLIATCAGSGA